MIALQFSILITPNHTHIIPSNPERILDRS
jgi:hypothetical protein